MDFDEFKALIFRGRHKKYASGSDNDASSTGTKSMSNSSSAYSNMSSKSSSSRYSSFKENKNKKIRIKNGYESVGQEDSLDDNLEILNQNISVSKRSIFEHFEDGISRLLIKRGKPKH